MIPPNKQIYWKISCSLTQSMTAKSRQGLNSRTKKFWFLWKYRKISISCYLVQTMVWKHICPDWGTKTQKYIDGITEGYCIYLFSSSKLNYSKAIKLILGVKNGFILTNKYIGRGMLLSSTKFVFFQFHFQPFFCFGSIG